MKSQRCREKGADDVGEIFATFGDDVHDVGDDGEDEEQRGRRKSNDKGEKKSTVTSKCRKHHPNKFFQLAKSR